MKDETFDRLFDNSDNLMRIARDRRVAAINANPRLAYIVRLFNDTGGQQELAFATSPEFATIATQARKHGILGQVHILDVTVRALSPRPLRLMPWQRVRARQRLGIAARR